MNDIGTPAWRPTASCTWRAFRSSGKKHLLLTGGRGSGKTTLLRALQPLLSAGPWPGVTTWARPGAGVWLRQERGGAGVQSGRFDPALPGPENRMRPTGGVDALGEEALEQAARAPRQWAAIDEIGYRECGNPAY